MQHIPFGPHFPLPIIVLQELPVCIVEGQFANTAIIRHMNDSFQQTFILRLSRLRIPKINRLLHLAPSLRRSTIVGLPFPSENVPTFLTLPSGQHVYQIGPNPPTRQQLQQNFGLSSATSRQVHADMQHVLLDIIIERLVETNAATMLIDAGPPYTHLMPLIPPLVERNIEDLLTNIDLLTEGPILPSAPDITREWSFDQANVALAFARRCGVDVERAHNSNVTLEDELDGLEDDIAETIIDSEHGGNAREPGQGYLIIIIIVPFHE